MIIGIGCDLVSHAITEKMKWHSDSKIKSRFFSSRELELVPTNLKQQISFLSGRFAVKEAVLKCLGTGMIDGMSLKEIEVLRDDSQKPILVLNGEVQKIALEKQITNWHITISHANSISTAFVIAERNIL